MLVAMLIIIGMAVSAFVAALVMKKITLAQVGAELVKLEGEAKVEEQAIVAKIKALIAKM